MISRRAILGWLATLPMVSKVVSVPMGVPPYEVGDPIGEVVIRNCPVTYWMSASDFYVWNDKGLQKLSVPHAS
jgi:hypothetical protein